MKTISITLQQDPERLDRFHVSAFSNTHELSVGDVIPRDRLEAWSSRPHIKFTIAGMFNPPNLETGLDMPERTNRADVLAMSSADPGLTHHLQPAEEPF